LEINLTKAVQKNGKSTVFNNEVLLVFKYDRGVHALKWCGGWDSNLPLSGDISRKPPFFLFRYKDKIIPCAQWRCLPHNSLFFLFYGAAALLEWSPGSDFPIEL